MKHVTEIEPTKGSTMVHLYKHSHFQKSEIERLVEELLKVGIITPNKSSYVVHVALSKKQYVSYHLCIDYRTLDRNTIKDKFPMPCIDYMMDELHDAGLFFKIGLHYGGYC